MSQTNREKLEEIRPDVNSQHFKRYYDAMMYENKGAQMYDAHGLNIGLEYILSNETQQRLRKVPQDKVKQMSQNEQLKKEVVRQALNFLD